MLRPFTLSLRSAQCKTHADPRFTVHESRSTVHEPPVSPLPRPSPNIAQVELHHGLVKKLVGNLAEGNRAGDASGLLALEVAVEVI